MRTILYVCVHNAGRSQMAEAFTTEFARLRGLAVRGASAGTIGGKQLNPLAIEAMNELGISMADQFPKIITQEMVNSADRVITMGCGVDAEACPAKFILTDDWGLDDPGGLPIEDVRRIRDEIRDRVETLLNDYAEAKV